MDDRSDPAIRSELETGIVSLGLDPTTARLDSLIDYLALLTKWNQAFNLSGIREPARMVSLHLLDSLAISPSLRGTRILDVGSGAGLPGVPLAIFNPERQFILLDSNGKKTRFLFQVRLALGLHNVTIENTRLEHYQCQEQIDIVLSRAFAALPRLTRLCSEATGGRGILLAMKGNYPEDEIASLPAGVEVRQAQALKVPGVSGSRYLIEIPLSKQA
jgi:16S rRNA (guanine527-N7)-methyltransferase